LSAAAAAAAIIIIIIRNDYSLRFYVVVSGRGRLVSVDFIIVRLGCGDCMVFFFLKKLGPPKPKKLSWFFGVSFFFAVPNIFYRYRTIENFYALHHHHHIIIYKYLFETVFIRRISTIFSSIRQIVTEIYRSIVVIILIE
jgi:hypothetical protein